MRTRRTITLLCLLSAGCATAGASTEAGSTLTLTRPDGSPVVCTKPPSAWLDSQEGVGVASAVPDLVQLLTATSKPGSKTLDTVVRDAPTKEALAVLDYRLCLEYGDGTLTRDIYTQWLLDLRPQAYQAVKGLAGR
ncbi:MAG: hypothetical protein LJF04_10295 [Gemmatimonadetes bacterium]|nr:hypothetical protein [Gemmatimonadota bacterium]